MRAGRELIILYAGRQTFKVSGDREQGRNPKKNDSEKSDYKLEKKLKEKKNS